MSFAIETSHRFQRELKQLSKRYASLLDDVEDLGATLSEEPHQGVPLGRGCYKIRSAVRSKGRARVVGHV
jgi:mRNA-degrading endonuclease RelE of RelBE toxin-antitoxin system